MSVIQMIFAVMIAVALFGVNCAGQREQTVWVVAASPGAQETLRATDVALQVLASLEPERRVGIVVPLAGGQPPLIVRPAPVRRDLLRLRQALEAVEGRPLPQRMESELVREVAALEGSAAVVLSPGGVSQLDPADLALLARSGMRVHVVAPQSPEAEGLAVATEGGEYSPADLGSVAVASLRAVAAALGRKVKTETVGGSVGGFSVAEGQVAVLAHPAAAVVQILDEGARQVSPPTAWGLGQWRLVAVRTPGSYRVLTEAGARVLLMHLAPPPRQGGISRMIIAFGIVAGAVALGVVLASVTVGRRPRSRGERRHARLMVNPGTGQLEPVDIGPQGMIVAAGAARGNGLPVYSLSTPGFSEDRLLVKLLWVGDKLECIPFMEGRLNGEPFSTPQSVSPLDIIEVGSVTISVESVNVRR